MVNAAKQKPEGSGITDEHGNFWYSVSTFLDNIMEGTLSGRQKPLTEHLAWAETENENRKTKGLE